MPQVGPRGLDRHLNQDMLISWAPAGSQPQHQQHLNFVDSSGKPGRLCFEDGSGFWRDPGCLGVIFLGGDEKNYPVMVGGLFDKPL